MIKRIGWFTTARGPGSLNLFKTLLENMDEKKIKAELSFVFINREIKGNEFRKKLVSMAQERGVPVIIFPSDTYMTELKQKNLLEWRREYGKELRKRILEYGMDLGVLAGYMLIVDPETCNKFPMINLHPALPNTYQGTWEEIVRKVVENKDQFYGSTVHLCTPELDRGAAIAFDSFPTSKVLSSSMDMEEAVKAIRAEELKREAYLLMEAIKLIVDEKVIIKDGCVTDSFGTPISPLCLSQAINKILSQKS